MAGAFAQGGFGSNFLDAARSVAGNVLGTLTHQISQVVPHQDMDSTRSLPGPLDYNPAHLLANATNPLGYMDQNIFSRMTMPQLPMPRVLRAQDMHGAAPVYGPPAPAAQAAPPVATAPVQGTPAQSPVQPGSVVNLDTSSPEAFIRSAYAAAQEAQSTTGLPAAIVAAMAANETGYGKYAHGNNYFGIKGANPDTGATFNSPTWEDYGNGRVNINDNFRAYGSPTESFADYARFLNENSRYQTALANRSDPVAFITELKRAGYATDPDYVNKILGIARHYGLL